MRRNSKALACVLVFSFLAIAFSSFHLLGFAGAGKNTTELPPMSLTIVGATGSEVVLDENDIAALPSYRAYGGFKKKTGAVMGLGNYTGVSLNTLCDLVGGLSSTYIVNVSANDYSSIFTFDEVANGNFTTYDSGGDEVPHSQPLVPIVAYYFNDVNITEDSGAPLRLAIVGPEGLVTNSTRWVKWVVRVEVIDEATPEFSSPAVFSLLLFATLVAVFSSKALRRKASEYQKGFAG